MKHLCVAGGGAALAQPVIKHYLQEGWRVTAVCHVAKPSPELVALYPNLLRAEYAYPMTEQVDLLVTMCGRACAGTLENVHGDDWSQTLQSNLTEVFKALKYTELVDGANVVVVGSIQAKNGYGCTPYAAAKAGLEGLVRGAALEWARRSIRVNLLELGYVAAGMGKALPDNAKDRALKGIPLGRFGTPDEVLHAVRFLAETTYMTGNTLTLAGGMR